MTAKVSQAMHEARKMVEKGATAYRAALDNGLTTSAITRSQWYKDHVSAKAAKTETKATPMERARVLVEKEGKTAYAAAKETGVAQSSISRAAWYRAHIDKQPKGGTRK